MLTLLNTNIKNKLSNDISIFRVSFIFPYSVSIILDGMPEK